MKTLTLSLFEPEGWDPLGFPFNIINSLHQLMVSPFNVIVDDDQIKIMSVFLFHLSCLLNYVNKLILLGKQNDKKIYYILCSCFLFCRPSYNITFNIIYNVPYRLHHEQFSFVSAFLMEEER